MPAAAALSAIRAGVGPPPISTASSSASAAHGRRVGQRLVQLRGHQRRVATARPHRSDRRGQLGRVEPGRDRDGRACPRPRCAPAPADPRCDGRAMRAASARPAESAGAWPPRWRSAPRPSASHLWAFRSCPTSTPRPRRRRRSLRRPAMTLSANGFDVHRRPGTGSIAESRPASTASNAGSTDSADGPDGTATGRRTAIRSPRCRAGRRAASLWRPGGRAPARRRRARAVASVICGDQHADVDVVELAAVHQLPRRPP